VPDYRRYSKIPLEEGESLSAPGWTKLPFPKSWDELDAGVVQWLEMVWGPEWRCPHCKHRFWSVLEAVRLDSASAWPVAEDSFLGVYPVVPVVCAWCRQITPVLLFTIFERPESTDSTTSDSPGES